MKNQIEDLKGQLNVCNLKLKDREFTLNKQKEDYEFQLSKSKEDLTNLKDKYEKYFLFILRKNFKNNQF